MNSNFFEDDFNVKEYINKRILEIDDLKERVIYREMAEKFMITLFEKQRHDYNMLTEKIINEVKSKDNPFDIAICVTTKSKFDETDNYLHPIFPLDNEVVDLNLLVESINNEEKFLVGDIFIKDVYENINNFNLDMSFYKGKIITSKGEYDANFSLEFNTKYIDKIKELYDVFYLNCRKWECVNIAYLMRMFCVYVESFDGEIDGDFVDFSINFESEETTILKDIIPLWNIKSFNEKTHAFPIPLNDTKRYEHQVYISDINRNSSYLVCSNKIDYAKYENNKLVITCAISMPQTFLIYEICNPSKEYLMEYDILTNTKKQSLMGNLIQKNNTLINTKAEINRIINAFDFGEKLLYQDAKILEDNDKVLTYNMNEFIVDELQDLTAKKRLILFFKTNQEDNFLLYDLMSFLVTQIQMIMPQFYCIGRLI